MYFIQGADQKQYGPITAEQLRQWIGENRLNRTSLCRTEESTEWKPLADFPEFSDAFGSIPAALSSPGNPGTGTQNASPDEVAAKLRPPAIGVIVSGAIGGLLALVGIVTHLVGADQGQQLPPGLPAQYEAMLKAWIEFSQKYGLVMNLLVVVTSAITILGGIRMMQQRSHGLVMAGVILAMLPCFSGCCCLGIPFGIWALVVLNKPEVKASFR